MTKAFVSTSICQNYDFPDVLICIRSVKDKGSEKEKKEKEKEKEREKEKKDNTDKILHLLVTFEKYVERKSPKGITATTAEIILGMINQLKTLL